MQGAFEYVPLIIYLWDLAHKYLTWCALQRITFFKRGPVDPSQQCKRASNNIQDPPPHWILTIFKLKFGGGNLFSPAMTSTLDEINFVGSLLKTLLKKVTSVVGSRMLCGAEPQNCIVEIFCVTDGQSLLSLPSIVENNFFFHFKRYNLTICAVNFFETFCTCSPNSLGQDPIVKIPKKDFFRFCFLS
jgi:hypothetical protein